MRSSASAPIALRTTLLLLGIVTALPALALIDVYALEWTYQVTETDPMVTALLRHRGALQLVLGAAIVWAAFDAHARIPVAAAAIVTKGVFLALILPDDRIRDDLAAFSVYFDMACIVFLAALIAMEVHRTRRAEAAR